MFNAVNFSDNVEMIVGALDPSARQKSCGPGSGGRDEPLPKKMNFIPPELPQVDEQARDNNHQLFHTFPISLVGSHGLNCNRKFR